MNWEIKRMDECCSFISDGDHLPPPKAENGIPFITITNIDPINNNIDFSSAMFVPPSYYDALGDARKARKNDILYSVVGSFGIPVLLTEDKKFVFQRHIALVRPDCKVVLPEFLYYTMKSHAFYSQADSYAIGSAQRTLSLGSLRKMKIKVPPLKKQESIASLLRYYDSLIDINNKRIKALEQMAENLYKEWFVRFRFPGHETAEFENGLPKGWEYKKLNAVFEIRYGKEHKDLEEGTIPIFGSGGIMRYGNRALFTGESVLIPRKGTLNNVLYYNGPFWTVDTMFYTVLSKRNFAKYAFYTLSSIDMESYNTGAALPSMTTDILYNLKILIPDERTLTLFDRYISDIYNNKNVLTKVNEKLIHQRDLLLPRLMSGKLEA